MVKDSVVFSEIEKRRIRQLRRMRGAAGVAGLNRNELAGIRKWQRPEQKGADQAEYYRVGADTQRKCQDRCHRKRWRAPQLPGGIAHIGQQVFDRREPPYISAFLFDQADISELPAGGEPSFFARQPCRTSSSSRSIRCCWISSARSRSSLRRNKPG